jgi:hypothetical protein
MNARAKDLSSHRAKAPPVMRPGVARARSGDEGAALVSDLKSRLDKASGREAIKLGVELTRARRAMSKGR